MTGKGDCYQVAARLALDRGLTLVHGEVAGTGPLEGVRFGHAWVEDEDTGVVIDYSNGRELVAPRAFYYAKGAVSDPVRYSAEEAARTMVVAGHYGPWHEEDVTP
jgi:hypothetical protein